MLSESLSTRAGEQSRSTGRFRLTCYYDDQSIQAKNVVPAEASPEHRRRVETVLRAGQHGARALKASICSTTSGSHRAQLDGRRQTSAGKEMRPRALTSLPFLGRCCFSRGACLEAGAGISKSPEASCFDVMLPRCRPNRPRHDLATNGACAKGSGNEACCYVAAAEPPPILPMRIGRMKGMSDSKLRTAIPCTPRESSRYAPDDPKPGPTPLPYPHRPECPRRDGRPQSSIHGHQARGSGRRAETARLSEPRGIGPS